MLCLSLLGLVAQHSFGTSAAAIGGRASSNRAVPIIAGYERYVSPRGNDSNDGTKQHPWATISHAGSVASPGTYIVVAPGVYQEAVVTVASGTAAARIAYVSDKKGKAVIAPPGRRVFSWKNTGAYTDIIGFEVAGNACVGIGLGGSFQRAIANDVHNTAEGCNDSSGGAGIDSFDYAGQANEIIQNYVHDVGIGEPLCGQPSHDFIQGIYQSNAGGSIDHNVSSNNCGWGIHLWHAASHVTITNNTVVGNRSGGIVIGSGDAPCTTKGCPGGDDFTVVRNNIVAYNGNPISGGWGIREEAQDPGQTGIHNEYSHNLGFQNASGDFLLSHGLSCASCIRGRDPQFVSLASNDYRLNPDSPAVGAGAPLEVTHGPNEVLHESGKSTDIGALPPVATRQR